MSKIKSALEIALERTENITIDKDRLKYNDDFESIRKFVSLYINENEDDSLPSLIKKLSEFKNSKALYQAAVSTLVQNINIQTGDIDSARLDKIKSLLDHLANGDNQIVELSGQIVAFIKRYPEHKTQLIEQMKSQFEPALREKEEKLRQTYGESFQLSFEQDKEFLNLANKNLDQLSEQYNMAIENAKDQIRSFFNIE